MLLVLSSAYDARGPLLCERWSSAGTLLMTPYDLQRSGWCYQPDRPLDGTAVASGERVEVRDIAGVCVLLPCVTEADVVGVSAVDRTYVASEMTAFLCAWLHGLGRSMINPPTPSCLNGPGWGPDRWRHAAVAAGLAAAEGPGAPVSVVGSLVFGATTSSQRDAALALARESGLTFLRVMLAGPPSAPAVGGADLWLDVSDERVTDAVHDLLEGRQR